MYLQLYIEFIKLFEKFPGQSDQGRMDQMCKLNPRYTLRNWMAQDAIKLAHEGDFSEVLQQF